MANAMVGYGKPALLPTPTKALTTQGQLAPSQVLPSSTTQPGQYNKAQADSSKKEKVTCSHLSLHHRLFQEILSFQPIPFPLSALETTDPRESYKWSEDSHQTLLPKEGNHQGGVQRDCPQSGREGKRVSLLVHNGMGDRRTCKLNTILGNEFGRCCWSANGGRNLRCRINLCSFSSKRFSPASS